MHDSLLALGCSSAALKCQCAMFRRVTPPKRQSTGGSAARVHDDHNLYRISTMSEAALHRRIHKIQRCDKLSSFAAVGLHGLRCMTFVTKALTDILCAVYA